jgi:hypothetical protein
LAVANQGHLGEKGANNRRGGNQLSQVQQVSHVMDCMLRGPISVRRRIVASLAQAINLIRISSYMAAPNSSLNNKNNDHEHK